MFVYSQARFTGTYLSTLKNIFFSLDNLLFFLDCIFKASALWADAFYKSICPSVRLFTFEVPFRRLFAPTSWSWMSKSFRDSESLGKNKWRNGLRFEIFRGVKSLPKKKVFGQICLTDQDFFVLVVLTLFNGLFPPLPEVQCPNFLDFWNPWGKVMERSGHGFQNFCKIAASKKKNAYSFIYSLRLILFLPPLLSKNFWFSESLRKSKERNGLRFENLFT